MSAPDPDRKLKRLNYGLHAAAGLAVLAAWLAADLLVLRPLEREREGYLSRAVELEALLHNGSKVRTEHARLKDQLQAAEGRAEAIYSRIPPEPREAEFLAQISELSDRVGLSILDYRPGDATEHPDHSELLVGLNCRGDYASLCRFLDGLAKLPRYSSLARLEIDAQDQMLPLTAQLTLVIYFGVERNAPPIAGSATHG